MADLFKSGSVSLAEGTLDTTVTGLALGFDPSVVRVSVRQPAADAPLLNAYVVGTPSRTSFDVTLSSPVEVSGYLLDWTAFGSAGSAPVVAGDSLQVDYTALKNEVARFLGYDETALSARQAAEVDGYVQSGVRNFYYPPMMEDVDPSHEWSFLRQSGQVALSQGVSSYLLPDGFGRVTGQLVFTDSEAAKSVPVIPYGDILFQSNHAPDATGRPRFAAVISTKDTFGQRGQRKTLYVFPKPDRAYTLALTGDADNGKLDAVNRPVPLGGPMFSELIVESCLAVAEQRANDEAGLHTQNFNRILVAMIQRDNKSGASNYGRMSNERVW